MMINFPRTRRLLFVLGAMVLMASAATGAPQTGSSAVGRFDFAYALTGDARIKPLQVFDDGIGKTFFQFAPGIALPAVFAGDGEEVLLLTPEGPYHVVASRARDFVLALGVARARVRHAAVLSGAQPRGGAAEPSSVSVSAQGQGQTSEVGPARYNAADPAQSSYATPLRGDVVEWLDPHPRYQQAVFFSKGDGLLSPVYERAVARLARLIGPDAKVQVIGAGDDTSSLDLGDIRARTLRASLMENGVPSNRIAIVRSHQNDQGVSRESIGASQRGAAPLPSYVRWSSNRTAGPELSRADVSGTAAFPRGRPAEATSVAPTRALVFAVRQQDGTVEAALRRWAQANHRTLLWDTPVVAPVTGNFTLNASSFIEAVSQVVAGMQGMGYPVRWVLEPHGVVRIVERG
ncbi:MAG: hypothetical protein RLZZ618_3881 [Pseudomonadota bacterium]|jgi:outer membrane protein OmpA-like peptidoglycan-associated protein